MSMMMALVGRTPGAAMLLAAAGLDPQRCGRLRDCFLNSDLQVVVFTRNGGGNRPDYEEATEYFRSQPGFVRDYDDDFDSTYAYYVLKMDETSYPTEFRQQFYDRTTAVVGTPMERFHRVMEKMQDESTPGDDPELVRAKELGRNVLEPIMQSLESGESNVVTVHSDGTVDVNEL